MSKLCKIMITCIVFLVITTAVYATTDILPENKFGIKKVAVLGAGVFLIVQILFIAYQIDKIQENIGIKNSITKDKKINIEELNKKQDQVFVVEEKSKGQEIESIPEVISEQEQDIKKEIDETQEKEENIFSIEEITKMQQEEKNLFTSIYTESEIETLPDKMSPKKKNITLKKEIYLEKVPDNKGTKRISRKDVIIVRERKNRIEKTEEEIKTENTKAEGQFKKHNTKAASEAKKQTIKAESEAKKRAVKAANDAKKRTTRVVKGKNKKQ